jgi:transglutaminase-like putative cysteine protease
MYRKLITILFILTVTFSSVKALSTKARDFEFTYSFTITDMPGESNEVELWLPIPGDTDYQKITGVNVDLDTEFSMTTEEVYNNKVLYAKVSRNGKDEIPISVTYKVKRSEISIDQSKAGSTGEDMSNYLKANRLVTISDRIKGISSDITKDKNTTIDKARAIYDYVFDKMAYDKSGEGWGRGDTEYACDIAKGNCTDFHSLFISLARASSIPARFKIGFPVPKDKDSGSIGGYHCWAEFYDKERGWIPVDISEAKKHPENKEYFFGNVCENRVELTVGRDLKLNPAQKGEDLNFFVYPYIEIDGAVHTSFKKGFSFKNI